MVTNNKATGSGGALQTIPNCYIDIPKLGKIELNILPGISDSKNVNFANENIMGRATPMVSYAHSEPRIIVLDLHFLVTKQGDAQKNLLNLRKIQSLAYPREGQDGVPYLPPPICKIRCGEILSKTELCVIMKSYSIKFPEDVAWDRDTYLPVRFDINTSWDVIYVSNNLPNSDRIVKLGS